MPANRTPEQKLARRAYDLVNREKKLEQLRAWTKANPEKVRANDRAYRKANKERINSRNTARNKEVRRRRRENDPEAHKIANKRKKLRDRFGLTLERFDQMWEQQGQTCSVCRRECCPVVDHCHKSGNVRALLCVTCNTALGMAKDDPAILQRMIAYLALHEMLT